MFLGDAIKCRKHNRHDDSIVLFDQTQDVLVVPKVKSSLSNLSVAQNIVSKNMLHVKLLTWK